MLGSKRKVMLQNKNDHKIYFPSVVIQRHVKRNTHDVMHLTLKNFIVGANAINNNFAPSFLCWGIFIEAEWRDPYMKYNTNIVPPFRSFFLWLLFFLAFSKTKQHKCEWLIKFFIFTVHIQTYSNTWSCNKAIPKHCMCHSVCMFSCIILVMLIRSFKMIHT